MNDDQRKHLEMIQAIISRLSSGSFTIKGWSVTLASALLALALKDLDWRLAFLSIFPVSLFWLQDAYFLYNERLFRSLYEVVRHAAVTGQTNGPSPFRMDAKAYKTDADSLPRALFSAPLIIFHGGLVLFIMLGLCIAGLHGAPSTTLGTPTPVSPTAPQGKVP